MSNTVGIILAVGISAVMVIVGLAVADNIYNAQTVELQTPYYAVKSSKYPLLEKR